MLFLLVCSVLINLCISESCTDTNEHCKKWARLGECKSSPDFMNKYCKKSCGKCPADDCKDINPDCKTWADEGQCKSSPSIMNKYCKKSCGLCGGNCKDTNAECPNWAKSGECMTNVAFMKKYCPKSCKFCGSSDDGCVKNNVDLLDREDAKYHNNVASWAHCAQICFFRKDCKYWLYHDETDPDYGRTCVTMSGYGGVADRQHVHHGSKSCQGATGEEGASCHADGRDIQGIPDWTSLYWNNIKSWSQCKGLCENRHTGCKAWVFYTKTRNTDQVGDYTCITIQDQYKSTVDGVSDAISGTIPC